MFNKIILVSLNDKYTKNLGEILSQSLCMLFCDTNDLIEYELIDKKAVERLCTKEYFEASEKKVIKHLSTFVDVVVAISFDHLIHNMQFFNSESLIVFLNLPKTYIEENSNVVDKIAYKSRCEELKKIATLTVNIKKTDINFVCEKLLNELGGIL